MYEELGRRTDRILRRIAIHGEEHHIHQSDLDELQFCQGKLFELASAYDHVAAAQLLDVAAAGLRVHSSAGRWELATGSSFCYVAAFGKIIHGTINSSDDRIRDDTLKLASRVEGVVEQITRVACNASQPIVAVEAIERLTSFVFTLRMNGRAMFALERRSGRNLERAPELDALVAQLQEVKLTGTDGNPLAQQLGSNLMRRIQILLASPALDSGDKRFVLSSPAAHSFFASRTSRRTLLYLVTGTNEDLAKGVAIRVDSREAGRQRIDCTDLPGLTSNAVDRWIDILSSASKDANNHRFDVALTEVRQQLGTQVWKRLVEVWPNLASDPLTIISVGKIARLPLTSALADSRMLRQGMDSTLALNATALHYASETDLSSLATGKPVVVADRWTEESPIPLTEIEAHTIAALYGVKPHIVQRLQTSTLPGQPRPRCLRSREPRSTSRAKSITTLINEISTAPIVHLACHGQVDDFGAALLIHHVVDLGQFVDDNLHALPARRIIILSACEVGSSVSIGIVKEGWGFPGGFISAGASHVIAPLWPVPDSDHTVEFAARLHRNLQTLSPPQALSKAVSESIELGVPAAVWASYCCFGV